MKNQSYKPEEFESKIYQMWLEKGCFFASADSKKPPFCIIMPPPNVTSVAHIGHAMDMTLQDVLARFKRMQGFETLWLPGADHAAIATEIKLVEKLSKEGKTKQQIGRTAFEKEAQDWYKRYGDAIMHQFRRMGFSADWSKYRFTMDESSTDAVLEAFVRLFNKGLIYRGSRLTNWCTTCQSVISDDEVVYSEEKSFMWHIRYPFADGNGHIVVATTRPETLFGDTAVAVNPRDKRYKSIVGKTLKLPLTDRLIPIISDEVVDKDFGTGMVKITPAHDATDYEIGKRHALPFISVFGQDGKLNELAGKFAGKLALSARNEIVEELKKQGFVEKIENYTHSVGHCERCKSVIEPLITEQWFVKMSELAKPAIDCVKNGDLKIYPKKFEKTYFHWLENIVDWCISRQLWTGHKIPIFYCDKCGHVFASKFKTNCPTCGSENVHQDPDVLDTWFSSALWPFSTLGWPNQTKELKFFYPTDVLVTAYDILTQWVTKMVYMGIECAGNIPFKTTLIHGLVRDEQGRKMSKSLGNGIDPLKVVDEHGADALRVALVKDMSLGLDTRFGMTKVETAKAFINKIWNASKFVLMNVEGQQILPIEKVVLDLSDKWILNSLNETTKRVTNNLEKLDLGLALSNVHNFAWNDFCDWFIEFSKPVLATEGKQKQNKASVLKFVLNSILKLLHPFVPYVTEYIFDEFNKDEILCTSAFPKFNKKFVFKHEGERMLKVMELVKNIRNVRSENGVSSNQSVVVEMKKNDAANDFLGFILKLVQASEVKICSEFSGIPVVSELGEFSVLISASKTALEEKKEKDIKALEFEIARSEKMLANAGFVAKAPITLIDAEKAKLETNRKLLERLKA